MNNIKQISKEFKKNGYNYSLLSRNESTALYKQLNGTDIVGYEVHKLRLAKARVNKGKSYPITERLAGNEDFGTYGWSYSSYDLALKKYNSIEVKQNE